MARRTPLFLFLLLIGSSAFPACGGGGGGDGGGEDDVFPGKEALIRGSTAFENESNETPIDATRLPEGLPGAGELSTPGDQDLWRFPATAGSVFRLTLHATRLDFTFWNDDPNVPRLRIIAPDGMTVLQAHDVDRGWDHGRHDLDFPFIMIQETGAHFIAVDNQDPLAVGGPYVFQLEQIFLPGRQLEVEAPGTAGANDDPTSAQPFTPGTMVGSLTDDDEDWYAITAPSVPGADSVALRFEVTAYRNGVFGESSRYLDARLALFASDGTTQRQLDGDSFFYDPAITWLAVPGRTLFLRIDGAADESLPSPYVIQFDRRIVVSPVPSREPGSSPDEAETFFYGDFIKDATGPGDEDYLNFEGRAGDMIRIWVWEGEDVPSVGFLGLDILSPSGTLVPFDRTGQSFDVVRAILPETGRYSISIEPASVAAYMIELELVSRAAFEAEDNDSRATADPLDADGRAAGQINDPGDEDFFRFDASEGELVKVLVFAKNALDPGSGGFEVLDGHGSDLAPQMVLSDASAGQGPALAFSDFAIPSQHGASSESIVDGLATSGASFIAPSNGPFFILLRSKDEKGGADQIYRVHVTRFSSRP